MKNILKNKKGNANAIILALFVVISGFALIIIGPYIYFSLATGADAGQQVIATSGRQAHATLTLTGNASCGERVNITTAAGIVVPLRINITTGCAELPANVHYVNVTLGGNGSVFVATNISGAINANATLSAVMTATNATNQTIITYLTRTTTGNDVALAEGMANGSWDSTTMYDGTAQISGQASQNSLNSYVAIVFPLMGLALMLIGFGVIYMIMRKSFGTPGR